MYSLAKYYKKINTNKEFEYFGIIFTSKTNKIESLLKDIKTFGINNNLSNNSSYYFETKSKFVTKAKENYFVDYIPIKSLQHMISKVITQILSSFIVIFHQILHKPGQQSNITINSFRFQDSFQNITSNSNAYQVLCHLNPKTSNYSYLSRLIIYDLRLDSIYSEYFSDAWTNYFINQEYIFNEYNYPKTVKYTKFRETTFPKTHFPNLTYNISTNKTEIFPQNYKNLVINYFNNKYNNILNESEYYHIINSYTPLQIIAERDITNYSSQYTPIYSLINNEIYLKNGFKYIYNIIEENDETTLEYFVKTIIKGI